MKSPLLPGLVLAIGISFFGTPDGAAQTSSLPGPLLIRPAGSPPPPATSAPSALPRPSATAGKEPAPSPGVPATGTFSANSPIPVPPPQAARQLPPPPVPPRAQLTFPRTAVERQRVTPAIEVWRASAPSAQVPPRRGNYAGPAYIVDNQPVMVRLQFDPLTRGKAVVVRPGRGAILDPPTSVLQIRPTGECVVAVRLETNAPRGHVTFHCDGLMTTLLLSRRPLALVQANENATAGGAR